MSYRTNQQGGIVSFIVIGIALASLLFGGLYLSKQQARIARDGSSPVITAPAIDQDDSSTGTDTIPATDTADSTSSAETTAPRTSQTATPQVVRTGPSTSVPATGPEDAAMGIFALGIVVYALTYLIYSRRSFVKTVLR